MAQPSHINAGLILLALLSWGCTTHRNAAVDAANLPAAQSEAGSIGSNLHTAARGVNDNAAGLDQIPQSQPAAQGPTLAGLLRRYTDALRGWAAKIDAEANRVDPGLTTRLQRAQADLEAATADRDHWQAEAGAQTSRAETAESGLASAKAELATAKSELVKVTKERDAAVKEAAKQKARADSAVQNRLYTIAAIVGALGLVALGFGAYMLVSSAGAKGGGLAALGAAGVVAGCLIAAFAALFWWFVGGSVVLLLAALGYVAYTMIASGNAKRSLDALREKAENGVAEVTQLVEHIKPDLPPEARLRIFGKPTTDGEAGGILTQPTKEMVARLRGKDANAVALAPPATAPTAPAQKAA